MVTTLRRFEVQARYALLLGILAVPPFVAGAALVARNYNPDVGRIVYGEKRLFVPALLGCLAVSILLGGVAFVLGFNSAGQRRNERPVFSWIGFFLGGTICTLSLILLLAFMMLRHKLVAA
ncbi:MAG: hypothetical protein J5J06_01080 [Phycisphaerae bacterium]|nr:hypothetical protein [Phycisphaerae bacterium]